MEAAPIFLLSPCRTGGPRTSMLLRAGAGFDLAVRLREGGATIGEIFSFISGLYFRGKLAYSEAFGTSCVIVPGRGLIAPDTVLTVEELQAMGAINVAADNSQFCAPLLRDADSLLQRSPYNSRFVLLGSVATSKYTAPLLNVFADRLVFPSEFVGRGDMSRGGLLLRCVSLAQELEYQRVSGAKLHGRRPPRLK